LAPHRPGRVAELPGKLPPEIIESAVVIAERGGRILL